MGPQGFVHWLKDSVQAKKERLQSCEGRAWYPVLNNHRWLFFVIVTGQTDSSLKGLVTIYTSPTSTHLKSFREILCILWVTYVFSIASLCFLTDKRKNKKCNH